MQRGETEGAAERHDQNSFHCIDLVMHKDLHDVHVDLIDPLILRLVGKEHKLDPQQGNEDESGPDCPHVQAGFSLMSHSQLGDENSHNVEEEK